MRLNYSILLAVFVSLVLIAGCGSKKSVVKADEEITAAEDKQQSGNKSDKPNDSSDGGTGVAEPKSTTADSESGTDPQKSDDDISFSNDDLVKSHDEAEAKEKPKGDPKTAEGDGIALEKGRLEYVKGRKYFIDKSYAGTADIVSDMKKLRAAQVAVHAIVNPGKKISLTRVLIGPLERKSVEKTISKLSVAGIAGAFTVNKGGRTYVNYGSFGDKEELEKATARARELNLGNVSTAKITIAKPGRTIMLTRISSKKDFDTTVAKLTKAGFSIK